MYPVQCAYPHVAGTTKAEDPYTFEARTGLSSVESDQEMRARIDGWDGKAADVWGPEGGLWEPEEELLSKTVDKSQSQQAFGYLVLTPGYLGGMAGMTSLAMVVAMKVC